ncbi:MAG TPA: double-strand break repair helicase AddA [Rhizomicrobium sp.]|nr:double-strand break repair helicase AddA [Rhizomicrobium sp.]
MTAQEQAADPKRSAWVSANAGAGKTYTLANRVTRLLLNKAKPERILCLTYTKAAAAEMESRLFKQLGEWAMASDEDLARRIAEIGEGVRDFEGLREARRLFALALETPGGLKIQTIHAFCQYLLARFPLEAGVPPAFRVLDDSTARELRDEARARVLDRAGRGDERLAAATATLVTQTSEFQLHNVLNAAFGADRRKLERFLARVRDKDVASAIRKAHGAGENETVDSIVGDFMDAMRREEKLLRQIMAWLAEGSANDIKASQRLAVGVLDASLDAFTELFHTQKGELRDKIATTASAKKRPDLAAALDEIAAKFTTMEERRRAAHTAFLAEAAFTLIQAARGEYEAVKRARSLLDYDDLILTAQRLLERRDAAQWVLYKLDGGLDHVLIDEAQDTSPEQWAIVTRLTEEFFAGEGIDKGARAPRTIFAVGDEKQSIFSFQGAEPREFEIHRRYFADRIGGEAFADVRLDVSRRSVPDVLRFVDQVFSPPETREGVVSSEEPISHRAHREADKGRVELWPLIAPTETPDPDPWRAVNEPSLASPVVRLAEQIAARIKEWTDGKTRLPGKTHAIRPGDIMVLMPRREPFATALIRALKMRGIPVAGADRIRIAEQIAVMDLVALGRFVLLPEDDLNLAALLRSPLIGFSEDELYALSVGRDGTLWQALVAARADGAHSAEAYNFLSAALARADYAPPHEFYASVLSTPGTRKRFLTRLGAEASDAVDEFLSLALSYEALNTPSLEGFLHWIEHGDAEVKRDMERARNEVRVMTVHGSKGLEADIVILPDTASQPGGERNRGGNILYTDDGPVYPVKNDIAPERVRKAKQEADKKAREEHRRLLYVALTRARDRLYVCGFRGKNAPNPHSWYTLAQRAAEEIGIKVEERGATLTALGDGAFETIALAPGDAKENIALEAWARRPAPEERERPRLIRPSDAAGAEESAVQSPVGAKNAARFRRGNLVHALLAQQPDIDQAQRHAAAVRYLAAQRIASDEAESLIAETFAVMDGPEFAAAFLPGARAEVAIVADLPEIAEGARISGRIDRLAITDAEVLAVDFKTNRPPPKRTEDVPRIYVTQMALYRAALAKIFPKRRIACALVWTDGPSLMRLEDSLLDVELTRIGTRLDPGGAHS